MVKIANLEPGTKINIWILGRKASVIFEKYLQSTDEVTFTSKGRSVTLGLDLIDDIQIDEKILHLVLLKVWYDKIESGEKPEDYREFTPYWIKRLCDNPRFSKGQLIGRAKIDDIPFKRMTLPELKEAFRQGNMIPKEFDTVCVHHGYTPTKAYYKFEGLELGYGDPKLGAPDDTEVFIVKLGDRINR